MPGATDDRLFFAQVREDPLLEIDALEPGPGRVLAIVGSGGCTALSLLAAGAERIVAVDVNRTQHHLTELKTVALAELGPELAIGYLGGTPMAAAERLRHHDVLAELLSPAARAWWSAHRRTIGNGILASGVTERFIGGVMSVVRSAIHPPSRVRRLLACPDLDTQRRFFAEEWDSRRWRLLFTVLLNRAVLRRTYDPAFFASVENPSFARHFEAVAAHTLTNLPVTTNYFVHQMLTGSYPTGVAGGLPPYLDPSTAGSVASWPGRLTLVEGGFTDYLRSQPPGCLDGFALSNICEWLTPTQVDELFAEIVRTAAPGAPLVFRNFLGWTEVPDAWRGAVVEDRSRGEALIKADRSAVQRRIAVCRVGGGGS